ncbi:hypothetical protein T440DRAFT_545681 [Plenodomus tracheiphilus IPT5]|uniref:Uncharacterized protein n=1 Tax=Plenodomus tracheiphilus IPT5 TaxID=1408161 RepID=A0A6A7APB1_9PLEO|nr:hypothetical protein T440DRAFT_545681 [Plenodomus tracheiphilus IPT5]
MSELLPHYRQSRAQIEALGNELIAIRDDLHTAANEGRQLGEQLVQLNRAAEANHDREVQLFKRLDQVELSLHQLLRLPKSFPAVTYDPNAPSELPRSLPIRSLETGGDVTTSPTPASFSGSVLRASTPAALAKLSSPVPSRASAPQSSALRTQDKGNQRINGGIRNVDILPMVIECILAEHMKHERTNRLRSCNNAIQQSGKRTYKCKRDSFDVECFREYHFQYCWTHFRVITGSNLACSHEDKGQCVRAFWGKFLLNLVSKTTLTKTEEHEDWEEIVGASIRAHNLGHKNVPPKKLKETLLPPHVFPHAYE